MSPRFAATPWSVVLDGREKKRALQKPRQSSEPLSGQELEHFERLVPDLTGSGPQIPYADMAIEFETSTSAIKSSVHRLRKEFGRLLREEIAHAVADPKEVDDELRHLLAVVQPWEAATSR